MSSVPRTSYSRHYYTVHLLCRWHKRCATLQIVPLYIYQSVLLVSVPRVILIMHHLFITVEYLLYTYWFNHMLPPHRATNPLNYLQPIGNLSTKLYDKSPSYIAPRPHRCFIRLFKFSGRFSRGPCHPLPVKGRLRRPFPK